MCVLSITQWSAIIKYAGGGSLLQIFWNFDKICVKTVNLSFLKRVVGDWENGLIPRLPRYPFFLFVNFGRKLATQVGVITLSPSVGSVKWSQSGLARQAQLGVNFGIRSLRFGRDDASRQLLRGFRSWEKYT